MRLIVLNITLLVACTSHAEPTIFDAHRNFGLSNDDKIFHDYYVDGGTEFGLKPGMVVGVWRNQANFDSYRNREMPNVKLVVAKVEVLQSQEGLSIVRLREEISPSEAPVLEDRFIMIGDRVDPAALNPVALSVPVNKLSDALEPSKSPATIQATRQSVQPVPEPPQIPEPPSPDPAKPTAQ